MVYLKAVFLVQFLLYKYIYKENSVFSKIRASFFILYPVFIFFFQGDMGPAGSIGPYGPQVKALFICELQLLYGVDVDIKLILFNFFNQGPPGLEGQVGPPGPRGPQVSTF